MLGVRYGTNGLDFNGDHLAITGIDALGNLLRTKWLALLREDPGSDERNAMLSDALTAAVEWAKALRKPVVVGNLDFAARKKATTQLSPTEARMLSGLLHARYQRLLEAKCFGAGAKLILIDPACTSTIGAVKCAARRGWSVHAAAGRHRPSRAEVD
ncbi:hypothetical protein [Paraburkholderia sp. BL6665CI2N2]|uniref:hypothetical protein n=1 Tax=Paraburkholderia sp. BL6665CI2N2 TaxID=1938806 RepID=UPI00106674B9|nr:hypothetical protein [Paraburkholderia sp. BL6665CI2N2]